MHKVRRYIILFALVVGIHAPAKAQAVPDSVVRQYESTKTNDEKIRKLYSYFNALRSDSLFLQKAKNLIDFLESRNDTRSVDIMQLGINDQQAKTGDYVTTLTSGLEIANRFEQLNDPKGMLSAYVQLSRNYYYAGDKEQGLLYSKKAFAIGKQINEPVILWQLANDLSTFYAQKNMNDSALQYARMAVDYAKETGDINALSGVLPTLAESYINSKLYDSALLYLRQAFFSSRQFPVDQLGAAWLLNDFSQIFLEISRYDSANYYAHSSIKIAAAAGFKDQLQRSYEYLSRSFDKTQHPDSAFRYLQLAVAIKDSLNNDDKTKQVQVIVAREHRRIEESEKEKLNFQNKVKLYSLFVGLLILGVIIFLLYRNIRQKQKANSTLQIQKEKVEITLKELKLTQQQLIQSEKMASLGELTAGIAHEIQNPLNFVNNFSEVSNELLDEMKDELSKGNYEDVNAIADDVKQNLEKINHHGKRADAIVKGMLQHSRSSTGQKEPTDINALADEYLRLAYHGLRGKDNSFNVTMKTDFDESIANVNVVPQDIGRVLLNLYNNAFYAASPPSKGGISGSDKRSDPTIWVSTKKVGDKVLLSVRDNGSGIPQKIVDKIFQPFFTTKPTGEGTGLGLSLAYDIVKAHGGELKVETKEGEGTVFTIQISNSI